VLLTPTELAAIRRQAEAEYPAECCGVLLVREGSGPERLLYRCRNVQDELHRKDPRRFPRDARTAYTVSVEDLREIARREEQGYLLRVIYHSHVDAGAYFSRTDREVALLNGEPAYPGVTYVVVSVSQGHAGEVRAYRWSTAAREFEEVALDPE